MIHSPARHIAATTVVLTIASGTLLAAPVQAVVVGAPSSAPVALNAQLAPSGDADGSGHAMLTLNETKRKVCATIHWTKIGTPDFAHIHKKSDGSIVVDLTGAVTGGAKRTVASRAAPSSRSSIDLAATTSTSTTRRTRPEPSRKAAPVGVQNFGVRWHLHEGRG